MSSKPTEPDLRLPAPAIFRHPWSITARLTWLYAGSTTLVLLLAAGYLQWGLKESLTREDCGLVTGKLQVLRLLLREQHDKADVLANEVEHEAAANELLKYYLRVLDMRGRVVVETDGMGGILPVLAFPEPAPLAGGPPPIVERTLASGRTYLMLAGVALTGASGDERRILQIALDVAHNDEILADYRKKLFAVLALGVVFAAAAGALVTRAGLRPLRAIARTTRHITASHLDERVTSARWPAELRELAQAFDAMLDRLEGSFNRLSEFSADIAHALRNPVNNLRGETEVALTRARSPEEYRQVLGSSLEEFDRLSRMIEGLLFIARADDPRRALERVLFDVRREMEAVREFYEALAAEQKTAVTCEGEAALTGEPMLVRRAISNLVGNALKHTPPGGRVTLATRTRPDAAVEITVTDSGHGIPREHLPRIFERFYQVDKTHAAPAIGAGLGLAIVQSIMHLHGGTAAAESSDGRGTTVTLTFPAVASRENRPAAPGG